MSQQRKDDISRASDNISKMFELMLEENTPDETGKRIILAGMAGVKNLLIGMASDMNAIREALEKTP